MRAERRSRRPRRTSEAQSCLLRASLKAKIGEDLSVAVAYGAVLVIAVLGALAAVTYLSVRTGDLARADLADGVLVVRPRGLNRLWSFKREVRVPLSEIAQVDRDVARRSVPSGFRMPGTYLPGLIQAGTYRRKGEKSFWLVGRTPTVTVVECPGSRFDRLVLQLGNETAAQVERAVSSGHDSKFS